MDKIDDLISELEQRIPFYINENKTISNVNVGWHLQHSLMVINKIVETTVDSDPNQYRWSFNMNKLYIFLRGSIPRGRGRAPKAVQPKEDITTNELKLAATKAKQLVPKLGELPARSYFIHPYFGMLNVKETELFLLIHTKHHLKIVDDILNTKAV